MGRRRGFGIACGATAAGGGLFMAVCRALPQFAARWQSSVARPLLTALHRLTVKTAVPLIEPAAIGLCVLALAAVVSLIARRTSRRPVILLLNSPTLSNEKRRRTSRGPGVWLPRAFIIAFLALVLGFILLWYPAYHAAETPAFPPSDAAALERLCTRLVTSMEIPPDIDPAGILERVPAVAGPPFARVKAARHPGWMRTLGLAGVFIPWTGEVIVNPETPPWLLPFTCVHELEHLAGVADEGRANIAAWRVCIDAGGAFAASAKLWALRYALAELARTEETAFRRAYSRLDTSTAALLAALPTNARPHPLARALGIGDHTTSYAALAQWLARHPEQLRLD